ncbi:hypothetical protein KKY_2373 [Pelagibacterium halotolerans B2]|uniref:Uncharacterized protein n=1 Tax=Pelagibacterium halotolerans (strain DSM 22347 / JCM 15775 / CGMCC 1.7692 / B2) TaxID=1082931 RepID=G4R8D8_PELHB|nr:hypothetical protein KKY_2373 [Pelagibacterium halotolerans B2]
MHGVWTEPNYCGEVSNMQRLHAGSRLVQYNFGQHINAVSA